MRPPERAPRHGGHGPPLLLLSRPLGAAADGEGQGGEGGRGAGGRPGPCCTSVFIQEVLSQAGHLTWVFDGTRHPRRCPASHVALTVEPRTSGLVSVRPRAHSTGAVASLCAEEHVKTTALFAHRALWGPGHVGLSVGGSCLLRAGLPFPDPFHLPGGGARGAWPTA